MVVYTPTLENLIFIACFTLIGFIICFYSYYPFKQTIYEQQFNKPHSVEEKSLKVVNLYFWGLFKKVVIINLAGKTFKYYINNYFKGKFFRLFSYHQKLK